MSTRIIDQFYLILIIMHQGQQPRGERKFKARWLNETTVDEIVPTAWDRAKLTRVGTSLGDQTKVVKDDLFQWDRDTLKWPKKRINRLKKEMEKLRREPLTGRFGRNLRSYKFSLKIY